MSQEIVIRSSTSPSPVPASGDGQLAPVRSDELVVRMWLNGKRSPKTRRVYAADAKRFFEFTGKPLTQTTLEDLQAFAQDLERAGLADQSRKRILAGVKSLFSFASQDGINYVRFNVAAALTLPQAKNTINERILTREQVAQMVAAASPGRNRLIVRLLYGTGVRAEELVRLCWRDLTGDEANGYVLTVFGKGNKTRMLRLSGAMAAELRQWRLNRREETDEGGAIFKSIRGGAMAEGSVWRVVSKAAKRAGFKASTHWLRHCHASHAIENGCDLMMLQQSLGHASVQTTEKYLHVRPKQSSGAFVELPESIESPGTKESA